MGIMAVEAFPGQHILMGIVSVNIFLLMAVKTKLLGRHPQQMRIFGAVWIMAGGAVASSHRAMEMGILLPVIIMAFVAEFRLGHDQGISHLEIMAVFAGLLFIRGMLHSP